VQEFQIGESSDGTRLRAAAAAWAAQSGDAGFVQVIELFIAEEQRHAAELARFLSINGHGVARSSPGDLAFRLLRHLTGGLEVSLTVLMTAEIIGFHYYKSLRQATGSRLLRAICDTFLRDEAAHLMLHAEQLMRMRRRRSSAGLWATRWMSRTLMRGACMVVWMRHRRVLKGGRLSFRAFLRLCLARLPVGPCCSGRQPLRHADRGLDPLPGADSLDLRTLLHR